RQNKFELLSETFERLNNAISTEEMRRLNYAVDADKRAPKDAANDWLKQKGF
ncbi:MAG: glycine/betaine ABC transporter substrate-binding protein, partial [Acidobacteria bacterium]|nr:glycine/betaine ABC transporter substrate-binding protein [Acidobacteriota bacterium]